MKPVSPGLFGRHPAALRYRPYSLHSRSEAVPLWFGAHIIRAERPARALAADISRGWGLCPLCLPRGMGTESGMRSWCTSKNYLCFGGHEDQELDAKSKSLFSIL